jgi:predicted DNA binding CopG/RHH family protein
MKKMGNRVQEFKTEQEERAFWATHSPLDYFDTNNIRRASLPKLKPSLKSISIRVPSDMLAELKTLANKKDVPYQSLAKVYLARQIALERGSQSRSFRKRRDLATKHGQKEYLRLKEIAEGRADYDSAVEVKRKNKKWKGHAQPKKRFAAIKAISEKGKILSG